MIRHRHLLLVTMATALVGSGFHGACVIYTQREQQQTLLRQIADLTSRLESSRRQHEAASHDVRLAEQQLSLLPSSHSTAATDSNPVRDAEVQAWLTRAKQLHRLADAHPDYQIPEMRLLADEQWLQIARQASFDTEGQCNEALAALRTAAKRKFIPLLSAALSEFVRATNAQPLVAILDLAPYLASPAEPAMLSRYAVLQNGDVREIAPVDEAYDSRYTVSARGGYGSVSGISAWIEDYQPRLKRAREAYATANSGAPPAGLAQVIPYINPPLPSATIEKILKAERDGPR